MSLAIEILTAIRFQNFNQAIFLLSIADQANFSYKYNLLCGILNYKNDEHTRAIFHLRVCREIGISPDQDEELRRTHLFYSALAYIRLKRNAEAIKMLESILDEGSDKKQAQKNTKTDQNKKNNVSIDGSDDYIGKILARYTIPQDSKYIHSLLASLLIKNQQSALSIDHFRKSINIYSSFIYLYENMLITVENITQYHYRTARKGKEQHKQEAAAYKTAQSGINTHDVSVNDGLDGKTSNFELMSPASQTVEEITAAHFKALRNDLLDFIKKPFLINPLIDFHKHRLLMEKNSLRPPSTYCNSPNKNIYHLSHVYYTSTLFLQSCATILFHNYNIDQSNFIFSFLSDLNRLDKSYQTLWSTILWLKREKEQLGILARNAVITQGNLTDKYSANMDNGYRGPMVEKVEQTCPNMTYESSETWIILSNYFSLCSDHNRSIICLKKAISSDNIRNQNIFFYSYLLLAHELMLKHDYEESLKMFYKTLRINHNSYSAMYGIGMLILKSSSYSDICSMTNIEQELTEKRSQEKNKTNTFLDKTEMTECTTAKHFFTRAMKIVPANKAVRYMLIRHMNKTFQPKDCLKEILKYFVDDIHGNDIQPNGPRRLLTTDFFDDLENIIISEPVKRDLYGILKFIQKSNLKDEYTDLILLEFVELLCSFKLFRIADKVLKTIKSTTKMYKKKRELVDVGLSSDFYPHSNKK